MKRCLAGLAVLLVSAGAAWADDDGWEFPTLAAESQVPELPVAGEDRIGLQYRFWFPSLGGKLRVDSGVLQGDDVDVRSDLGLSHREMFNELSAWINHPGAGNFRVSWLFGRMRGASTVDETFTIDDSTFTVSADIDSKIWLDVGSFLYERPFLRTPQIGMPGEAVFQVGARYLRATGRVQSGAVGLDEKHTIRGVFPMVGVRGTLGVMEQLRVGLELNGILIRYRDVKVHVFDVTLEALATPWEGLFVGLGYRYIDFFAERDGGSDVEIDLGFSGLFFSVGWLF
ncbi:MAG: porin family protein [Planctomycetota bacterium]|jgi:hypothetical protein